MSLFQTKPKLTPEDSERNKIACKIQQRRYQVLVHSLLYYELNINLVSDDKWSEWARELAALQREHPNIANTVVFANAFKDFDGSTGYDLPYTDEQIVHIARKLLRLSSSPEAKIAIGQLNCISPTPATYSKMSRASSKPAQITKRKEVNKNGSKNRKKLF